MKKQKGTVLNCFSPPVMIATMVIEVSLAIYTLFRYKLGTFVKLSVLMLIGLATFQLAEFNVCQGNAAAAWSRVGFVAITALPPLGLHMMHVLANKKAGKTVAAAYLTMLGFMVFFLTYSSAFSGHQCTGNYVIFHLSANSGGLYYAYYYGWLAAGIALGVRWAKQLLVKGKMTARLQAIQGLIAGYLVFLIPTTVVNTLKPSTISGLPSVMCGFAVLFALILGFYILPRAAEHKRG